MLDDIKLLLGITSTDKDNLLQLLINQATEEALDYTRRGSADGLENIITKMVVFNYNRIGTEGLDSESYSGVSYSYSADYPESILRSLNRYRKLITL
jgi:hypothetical protein